MRCDLKVSLGSKCFHCVHFSYSYCSSLSLKTPDYAPKNGKMQYNTGCYLLRSNLLVT